MKKVLVVLLVAVSVTANAQPTDKLKIERACLDYLEGFYEGDVTKLVRSLKPSLYKFGYGRNDETGEYEGRQMTFDEALAYADNVKKTKNFAEADAPKEVVVFEVGERIASAKVTAFWGIDYLLLARQGDHWMIEQAIWEERQPNEQ